MALFGLSVGRIASLVSLLASCNTWQVYAEDTNEDDVCMGEGTCSAVGLSLLQKGTDLLQKHGDDYGSDDYGADDYGGDDYGSDDYDYGGDDYSGDDYSGAHDDGATVGPTAIPQCMDYTAQYDSYDDSKPFAATDAEGQGCASYADGSQCGLHNDEDFIAQEMCCSCGGGSTSTRPRSLAVNNASVFLAGSQCPEGFSPIDTLAACRAALDMTGMSGMDFMGFASEAEWPKGCYVCKNVDGCPDGVWFNGHVQGQVVENTHRFCQRAYIPMDVKVLFVGDSDIDFWDSSVGFPGSFNVGVGGYTTEDVIGEVDLWVAALDPQWVVIVCGENDIEEGNRQATDEALARFQTIVHKFIQDGSRVIYLGTKPEPGSVALFPEYQHYDAEVRRLASSLGQDAPVPPFQMIDVFQNFKSKTELFNSDDLHMSRLGYTFWNGWVKIAMESKEPCIRWRDGVCVEVPGERSD